MYHISDIKKYLRCKRFYFYSLDADSSFNSHLRVDESMTELIASHFGVENYYIGARNDAPNRFFDEIANYDWFFYARFVDNELRFNIPLIHKFNNNSFDVYYVYYGTAIKDYDFLTYRIIYKALNRQNINVNSINIIYFNEDYSNNGNFDATVLFKTTDQIENGTKIVDYIKNDLFDYDAIINQIKNREVDEVVSKTRACRINGVCEYYYSCFSDEETIEDDSILTLVSSRYKNEMYDEGIKYLKDADLNRIEGTKVQYAQILASKNGGLFVDHLILKAWLERISDRPISFIDFEWDRYLLPKYKDMKPMDVVCFEFALYYIDKNGHMQHRTFLSTGDCRKEFVEALIQYLPASGPILAYNAEGAECLRLKELALVFPEYADELFAIIDRFVDLAVPFMEGYIYDTRLKGNFSLKKLVSICSNYTYQDLDINDGMMAVYHWRNVDNGKSNDEKILDDLKEYCSLDAYGLFLIYRWLVELTFESE